MIEIRQSPGRNRGIFATTEIKAGDIIEICPTIEISKKLAKKNYALWSIVFRWKKDSCVILLGYGSLYNHSFSPNAVYEKNFERNEVIIRALSNIEIDSEIFINYNGDPTCCDPLWFSVI